MKNFEKYKTIKERNKALNEFCNAHPKCSDCELREKFWNCYSSWLDLEVKEILKPCPFCGGEAIVVNNLCDSDSQLTFYSVICKRCHSKTRDFFIEDEAIEQWNRRN